MILDVIKGIFTSRKAVKAAKANIKEELKVGKSAPQDQTAYLRFRALMRAAIVAFLTSLSAKFPVLMDPAIQGIVIDGLLLAVWGYFGVGAASDLVRTSTGLGVPRKLQTDRKE